MAPVTLSVDIRARSQDIFDLIHDYTRRLEWDAFLREARLLDGAVAAGVGVQSRCVARWAAGGAAMETEYVSFSRPQLAAVKMTKGPWFLRQFAASIRHRPLRNGLVRVEYRYTFRASPAWLAFVIAPTVGFLLNRETRRRLAALKEFLESNAATVPGEVIFSGS